MRVCMHTFILVLLTSMLCKLGVGQDLFAELEPVSVLFVFVTSLSKEGKRNHIRSREPDIHMTYK